VRPKGPWRERSRLYSASVVAADVLVSFHDVLVILLLCGIPFLPFETFRFGRSDLFLCCLELLPWGEIGVLHPFGVELSLDHFVPLLLIFHLMLQLRQLCVGFAVLLPQSLDLLLHALEVAEDVEVLLVRLIRLISVLLRARLHL